jgi:hypothetical protein
MKPKVISVEAVENYLLELVFNDGTHRIFDVKPYLEKGDFNELKDPKIFATAHVFMGTVQWENELDFAPDTLYEESKLLVF